MLWGDALYYYAYTRSIVVDADIDFENEAYRENGGFPNPPEISEITGKVTNKFSPGVSLLWMPGFSIGQFLGWLLTSLGILSFDLSGYGLLTLAPVVLSSITFGILGLMFIDKTLRELGFAQESWHALIALFLTTPLFYYMTVDPVNSHPAAFMLASLLLYLSAVSYQKVSWQKTILAGLIAGMLILVRNQDFVLTLPIAVFLIWHSKGVLEKVNQFVLFYGSAFVVFSVQLFFTLELFGLFTSPYLHRGEQLSWLQPDFLRVLFSFENGLFVFSPLTLVAVIFLVRGYKFASSKKEQVFTLMSCAGFLLAAYVIASWGPEILGGPYGSRMFLSSLPFLSIGVALALKFFKQKYEKNYQKFFFVFIGALTVNMIVQTLIMLVRY